MVASRMGLALALISAPLVLNAQSDDLDCSDPQTQLELNSCAALDLTHADEDLDHTYQLAMQSWLGGVETPAGQALLAAQDAWLIYRTAHCDAVAQPYEGGSIQPLIRYSCLTELTRARTEAIRAYAEPEYN